MKNYYTRAAALSEYFKTSHLQSSNELHVQRNRTGCVYSKLVKLRGRISDIFVKKSDCKGLDENNRYEQH